MKIKLSHKFEDIVSIENLLEAWREFVRGKRNEFCKVIPEAQSVASGAPGSFTLPPAGGGTPS